MLSTSHGRSTPTSSWGRMSEDEAAGAGRGAKERGWRLLAAGVGVGALALLAAFGALGFGLAGLGSSTASAGRSLEAVLRSPGRDRPPPPGRRWSQTPVSAVTFYGGYFCARVRNGRRVWLVLALRELDTLAQGSTSVVGPFASKAQARDEC